MVLEGNGYAPKHVEEEDRKFKKREIFQKAEELRKHEDHPAELSSLFEMYRDSASMPDCVLGEACAMVQAKYPGVIVTIPPGRFVTHLYT